MRLTVGGDRINYPDDCGTPTADMTLFKILVNSIISTPGAKCFMMDIKDCYLNTPMKWSEYICLKILDISDKVINHYNLEALVAQDGYIYCEIKRGMYSLPQAGLIAQELLEKRLAEHGYHQSHIQWTLDTQDKTHLFLSLHWQLCGKIHQTRRCRPFN